MGTRLHFFVDWFQPVCEIRDTCENQVVAENQVVFDSFRKRRFAPPEESPASDSPHDNRFSMGKRLSREKLLAEMDSEWEKLQNAIRGLSKKQLSQPNVNSHGWALKDVLAHVLDWQQRNVDWYHAGVAGNVPALPADGFSWNQTAELNEKIFRAHRRTSATEILQRLSNSHTSTRQLIQQLSADELTQLNHYAWTGKSWTLSDYFRAGTASHYRWASKKFRRWKRENPIP